MSSKEVNKLKFNQYIKSDKMPYIISAYMETSIKEINWCDNNLENSLTTEIGEYIRWGDLMSTTRSFDHIENKHILYHKKDCLRKICSPLRQQTKSIICFEKEKLLPLTKNWKFNVPNEVIVVFHDGSNFYYHFFIKELTNECERNVECPGQNTE